MWILRKIYYFFVDTLQSILIAASIFLVIYMFFFRPFQVNGESMHPNFEDGEYVLTNLITLRFHDPVQGDVIVFKAPPDPEKDFIKRVIGVPGDSVMLKDGDVYVNAKLLDQSGFLSSDVKTYGGSFLKEGEPITVPEGEFFVMGDNRPYSSDSREWGFVKREEVIGESFFIYWPLNRSEVVKNPYAKK
jgi:signal peptidase I